MSLRAYAKHRGVSLSAVQKAIRAGRVSKTPDGKIDPVKADAEWKRNTTPPIRQTIRSAPPITTDTSGPTASPAIFAVARGVREQYLARLTKIEYEERVGKLISSDEVRVAAFNRFRVFRDAMLNMPDRIGAVLAAESDPAKVHSILASEIRNALNEFADKSTNG